MDLGRVQQDLDPDPNFFIGPKLGPESIGFENFTPRARPLGSVSGSRTILFFFREIFLNIYYEVQFSTIRVKFFKHFRLTRIF